MNYYLLLPGDTEEDCYNDTNLLGSVSFKNFWAGEALKALNNIVNTSPELLTSILIKNDKGENLSIEGFLDIINKLNIRVN